MVPWWYSALIIIFGVLAVVFIIGVGLVMSLIYDIRSGSASETYRIAAIGFVLGMASAGIAASLALQEKWVFPYSVAVGLFGGGLFWLMSWLMSRFTK